MSELKEIEWESRSEFNKEIINVLYECGVDDDIIEERTKLLELKLKDMIMGLKPIKYLGNGSTSANGKYNKNLHPMTLASAEAQHIDRSDLENLFKEDE